MLIQAAKISFLWRVSGLSLRDGVKNSETRGELGLKLLLIHVERTQLRLFRHLVRKPHRHPFLLRCSRHIQLVGDPGEDSEHTGGTIYLLACECLGILQRELEGVTRVKGVWVFLLSLMSPQPVPNKQQKMDGLLYNSTVFK